MQSRLKTLDSKLAARFEQDDTDAARKRYLTIFKAVLASLDDAVLTVINDIPVLSPAMSGIALSDASADVLRLDSLYFEAEEAAREADAFRFFAAARLAAALDMARVATGPAGYAEAAYEALMATQAPEALAERFA